ncbi:MAG: hypothetical protein KY459_04910 [Acidobacteria bacterium]|nr:hypothetical protein [Acidobacteriota bacterium]
MKRTRLLAFAIVTVLMAGTAVAGSFIVPPDEILVDRARVIASGVIVDSWSQYDSDGSIETIYRLAVDEILKGSTDPMIEFREHGGVIGNRWEANSAMPVYERGNRYLIMFDRFRDGRLTTLDFVLGKFEFRDVDGARLLVRQAAEIEGWDSSGTVHREPARHADRFLRMVRERVAAGPSGELSADATIAPSPMANDLDTVSAAQIGSGAWSSGSIVNYTVSGTPASGDDMLEFDGEDRIIVDDPHGEITGSFPQSSTLATAFFGGFIEADRIDISGSDIVVNDGVSSSTINQNVYNTMMTHEMGHTLGFRHSNQNKFNEPNSACDPGAPCTTDAVMNSSVSGAFNGNLQPYDSNALSANYATLSSFEPDYLTHTVSSGNEIPFHRGGGTTTWFISAPASCTGPTITAQPTANPTTITAGESSTLSISATDFTSIAWFRTGSSTSIGSGTSITVSPTATSSYFARVTNACTSIDSNSVTVTVVEGCTNVAISTQPASRTIEYGTTTFLSVSATGTSPTYQWFVGNSGDTSNPIAGATSSEISVRPLTTTSYWVRVSNSCPSSENSTTATVTVLDCQPARITSQPPDQTVESGQRATLSVSVSGSSTFTFRWYQGNAPDTSNLVSSSQSFLTPPLTQQTTYWVRVSNDCGTDDSGTVTINIVAACEAPVITQQPQSTSVQAGGSATLSVMATGTALQYQWLEVSGTTQTPISGATGATFTTPALTSTKSYAVRVSNSCGTRTSNTVTVTVTQCQRPMITKQPQDITIPRGAGFTLTVEATGEGFLQYQWFVGQSGDTSRPISGGVGPGLFIGTLDKTTSYWVQVTNGCGSTNSATATVSISPRRRATLHR